MNTKMTRYPIKRDTIVSCLLAKQRKTHSHTIWKIMLFLSKSLGYQSKCEHIYSFNYYLDQHIRMAQISARKTVEKFPKGQEYLRHHQGSKHQHWYSWSFLNYQYIKQNIFYHDGWELYSYSCKRGNVLHSLSKHIFNSHTITKYIQQRMF